MGIAIGILSAVVSAFAAGFTWYQARAATRAVKQAAMMRLFSTFDVANQATLSKPALLYSVHGLDRSIPPEEAANIAYFSFILDGFQHFYGEAYDSNFSKMTAKLKQTSTFLNRILQVPENQTRWNHMKKLYYGDFDKAFVNAIDELIAFERSKQMADISK
jgi:hypothetical protein